MNTGELAIIMVFSIPLAAILGGIFIAALKVWKGGSSKGGGALDTEETKLMQEIHQGLAKMEKRVENLETLLLDRARMEKENWTKD